MRKLLLIPAVLLINLVVFQSCSKQSSSEAVAPMSTNIINATIAPNGSYQLSLDNSINATVSISKQAAHFQISQTEIDSKSGLLVYRYIPAADYRGVDEVLLSNTKISEIASGSGCPNNPDHNSNAANTPTTTTTSYTTIKLNINN